MANEIKAKYNCTQTELYSICRLGWNMVKGKQAEVVLRYPEYTIAYIDGKLTAVGVAEAIPDFQMRDLLPETAHIVLKQSAEDAIKAWKLLERYIIRSFQSNKELIKPNVEAAGKDYYEAATRENPNWEDLKQMILSGNTYITDNLAVLTSMPATFPLEFAGLKTDYDAKYDLFILAEAGGPEKTSEKIIANNEIFDDLMLMLGDIVAIAPTAEVENEFTFTYLKGIISSPGAAGLTGSVKVSGSNYPISGAVVTLQTTGGTPVVLVTNAEGLFSSGNLPIGLYTAKVTKNGFGMIETEVEIKTGTTSRKDWLMSTGGGTVVVLDGEFGVNEIENISIPAGANEDTWVTIEGLGTEVKNYASSSVDGEQTGTGALYASDGPPLEFKWSVVVAQIGLDAGNPYYNVKNVGGGAGGWRMMFVIA